MDNTPRILFRQDEGIVQPISKDMEPLSRRLHQSSPPWQSGQGVSVSLTLAFVQDCQGMVLSRTVSTLSTADAAYIAGLLDGEGTVTLVRKHRNENHQLALSISNTDLELLRYVRESVGAGKITSKRTTRTHHTPSYTYAIYNRQALALLAQLTPYLRTYKSKRASRILENYVRLTKRNGKYTAEQHRARQSFVERVMAIRPGNPR